jgi:hypothetical protein
VHTRAIALLFCLAAVLPLRPAAAELLHVGGEPEGVGGCNLVSAEVLRWTPADGPPAAFVASTWTTTSGNVLVLLGADGAGFWTAEIDAGSDACDDCRRLHLARTAWNGRRTRHLVVEADALRELGVDEQRGRVKRGLFALWPATGLAQTYRVEMAPHDAEGRLGRYTGWFAGVRVPDRPGVRFGVQYEPTMCWCDDAWHAYALR